MTRSELERASQLCRDAGAWLIMDNTYEHFVYDGREHICISGPHVLHIFSFSKVSISPVTMPSPLPALAVAQHRLNHVPYDLGEGGGGAPCNCKKVCPLT